MTEPITEPKTNRWSEAFAIFERHGMGDYDICAEHDEIFVQCPRVPMPDAQRLIDLGWSPDTPDDGSWRHFV